MALEFNYMLTTINIKVCLNKEKDVARALITFHKDKFIKESLIMVKYKDLEFVDGLMVKTSKDTGWITKKVVRVYSNGLMVDNIKVLIEMIKNMVLAGIYGQITENILDNGRTIKDMEKDNIL
jgi:hypothetical protein